MNGLIGAVADLLEHVASSTEDLTTSEAYALRLALLLRDPEFATALANARLGADDVQSMSLESWMWYLEWRSEHAPSPSSEFLDALFEASAEPIIRYGVVDSVVRSAQRQSSERQTRSEFDNVQELPIDWLRHQLGMIVEASARPAARPFGAGRDPEDRALELASYLFNVGTDSSLAAIRALLRTRWPGRQRLVGFLRERLGEDELAGATRLEWLQRLGLTDEQRGDLSD